jgi:hypothetical protein
MLSCHFFRPGVISYRLEKAGQFDYLGARRIFQAEWRPRLEPATATRLDFVRYPKEEY